LVCLTEAQKKVLDYIEESSLKGFCPTMLEISGYFGWQSANSAYEHCRALVKKGYLYRDGTRYFVSSRGEKFIKVKTKPEHEAAIRAYADKLNKEEK